MQGFTGSLYTTGSLQYIFVQPRCSLLDIGLIIRRFLFFCSLQHD
jgi:hypothetical protein